jgi:glutathione S-transferase
MPIERQPMPNLDTWYRRLDARPAFRKAVCVSYADMFGMPVPPAPR